MEKQLKIWKLKSEYNKLIVRYKKAEKYFETEKDASKFEKWIPEHKKLISEISQKIEEYKELTGIPMTGKEQLEGFEG
jgi:predicted patatin/cPLA2 family phospholipase